MKTLKMSALVLAAAAILPCTALAQSPTWSPAQSAVWSVVSQSWVDETSKSDRWPSAYAAEQMVAWEAEWPMPRNAESLGRWTRFSQANTTTLQYEITPTAIALSGDTAVVAYASVQVTQTRDAEPSREARALIETLVRVNGQWKFLATTSYKIGD